MGNASSSSSSPSSSSSFAALLADDGAAFPSEAERRSIIADPGSHVAYIPFSSGTTGMPKGVELTHRNLVANIMQVSVVLCRACPRASS